MTATRSKPLGVTPSNFHDHENENGTQKAVLSMPGMVAGRRFQIDTGLATYILLEYSSKTGEETTKNNKNCCLYRVEKNIQGWVNLDMVPCVKLIIILIYSK